MHYIATSERQWRDIFIGIIRNCNLKGHCTGDAEGRRIAECVQTYPVCCRCLHKRQRSVLWNPPVHQQESDNQKISGAPHRIISMGLRSGGHGRQATGRSRLIHLPGYVASTWLRTTIAKYAGTPSCMNHMFWSTVAGISCLKSGRRAVKKTR